MTKKIWFDANNSPHVLVLTPIIKELQRRGYETVITARNYAQTIPLIEKSGLEYQAMGKHGGKSKLGKLVASSNRITELAEYISAQGSISGSFCHGSRELIIASKLLGIPSMAMFDYEYAEKRIKIHLAGGLLVPSVISESRLEGLGYPCDKIFRFPGLKENLYIDETINVESAHIHQAWRDYGSQILIVLRPPSTESHYHNTASENTLELLFSKLDSSGVKTIILPRYSSQRPIIDKLISSSTGEGKFVIPEHVINGPELIRAADLCISGGGTMIREAAVLGTPAYSIFSGDAGAVDEYLQNEGRLTIIRDANDLCKIELKRKADTSVLTSPNLASYIADLFIENIVY